MAKQPSKVYMRKIATAFVAWIDYALVSVAEIESYLRTHQLGGVVFSDEAAKETFSRDSDAIATLINRFVTRRDLKTGRVYSVSMVTWARDYLDEYRIDQVEADALKMIYGFGVSLAQFIKDQTRKLEPQTRAHYIRVARHLTVRILNRALESSANRPLNAAMFLKLCQTMYQGREQKLLGRFGVYMIFKNCEKFAEDLRGPSTSPR